MGIRGLTQFANGLKTKKRIPLGHISHERHKIWAIDASLFLYRARCLSANHSSETSFGRAHRRPHRFRNVVGDVPLEKSHLVGIVDVVSQLLANGITPVIVFDGPPPQEKSNTIRKRKSHKENTQQNITWIEQQFETDAPPSSASTPTTTTSTSAATTSSSTSDDFFERAIAQLSSPVGISSEEKKKIKLELELEKQKLAAVFLQPYHFYQTQSLCEILGIPFIRSRGEAEVTCVELLRNQKIDAVYTADSDVLVFGCTRMIRRIINDEYIDALDHNFVIQELGINHEQFVCMCILIGCDFCEPLLSHNSFTQALELVKHFPAVPFEPIRFLKSFHTQHPVWTEKATRAYELYTVHTKTHIDPVPTPCIPENVQLLIHELQTHLDMQGTYVQRVVEQVVQSFQAYKQFKRPSTAITLGLPTKPGFVPYIPHGKANSGSERENKRPSPSTAPVVVVQQQTLPTFNPAETLVALLDALTAASHESTPSSWFWTECSASAHIWCPPAAAPCSTPPPATTRRCTATR